MSPLRSASVTVTVVAPGPTRAADREALAAAVASAVGVDTVAVRTGRQCPHCGSSGHGRPWAEVDGAVVHVSLARTTGLVALAVGSVPIGIDVERVSRVAAAPLDAFTADELARAGGDPHLLAACWSAKEAVLKRDGRGLRVDARTVSVDLDRASATLDGVSQPVTVLRPAADVVLAVAAGGAEVTLIGHPPTTA